MGQVCDASLMYREKQYWGRCKMGAEHWELLMGLGGMGQEGANRQPCSCVRQHLEGIGEGKSVIDVGELLECKSKSRRGRYVFSAIMISSRQFT